jgi:hypothetical protein
MTHLRFSRREKASSWLTASSDPSEIGPREIITEQSELAVTRRAFLAGAAGTVAGTSVGTAQSLSAAFGIEETEAAITVHFLNYRCSAPLEFVIPKVYWTARPKGLPPRQKTPRPTFTVDDKAAPPRPDGVATRTVRVSRACFAGMAPFDVSFEFTLSRQDCTIGLTTKGWPLPGTSTRFAAVDFIDFMAVGAPGSQPQSPLQVPFSAKQSDQLLKQLFGNGLKCSSNWTGQGSLAVGRDLSWTLSGPSADAFSVYPGLAGDVNNGRLGFRSLRFAPTTPATKNKQGKSDQQSPFDKEILTRAFPADSSITESEVSIGFSGVSVGPFTGGGVIQLGNHGGISVTAQRSDAAIVGFAQTGNVQKTLTGVLGDFDVAVIGSKGDEGLFLTEGGRIVRYGDGGVTGFARLPILGKPFEVKTAHGRFIIEAPDPIIPEPGAERVKPGIVLSTTKNGDLQSFEISALLRHASIPFPERRREQSPDDAKAQSDGKLQCLLQPQRPFFSRLDFAGGDCRFVLDSLAEPVTPLSARSHIRLGGEPSNSPIQLGLDQATLRVVRPDDLLSLTFRFSGLALSVGATSEIVPLRAVTCGLHLAESVNEKLRAGAALSEGFRAGAAVDDRPIMVVEFPPQHVAERAYLRQIDDGEDPPDVALDEETIERYYDHFAVLDRYRKGHNVELERRIAARLAIQCAKQAAASNAAASAQKNLDTAAELESKTQTDAKASADAKLKAADAKVLAANAAKQTADASKNFKAFCERFDQDSQWAPGSSRWPDDQKIYIGSEWLDLDVRRFARGLAAKIRQESAPQLLNSTTKTNAIDPALRERLPAVDPRDPDFVAWAAAYDSWGEQLVGGLPRYCGPDSVQALVDTGQLDSASLAILVAKIAQDMGSPEAFSADKPTETRLSGPSRLAFRINCDDFEGGGGAFPFTLADLTSWSRFDLAVVRRAEKLLAFNSAGRLPPHWARSEILDAAATLAHQGINPGQTWPADPKAASVTAAQRMAEVYASANTPPTALETAIELPFRLILSPAQDARWRTPVLLPNCDAPTPLWQASLEEDVSRSSLRAIWSEDFQPDTLRDGASPPPHGPWAPWDTPIAQADGGPPHSNKRFRAVMDAGDRHELVTLTSVYGLPVIGRRDANTGQLLADGNQIEPPPGYSIYGLKEGGDAIYSPRTLTVTELALSALGGSLSADTHFEPPAAVTLRNQRNPIFQALDVERWRHTAVLGRDISVEVVYKGFLYPLGNRASFVKLTERRFMQHPHGGPTAYLIQRLFLRIGHPTKNFPALGQANLGRAFPPKAINILTRRTPDLVDPNDRPSIRWGDPIDHSNPNPTRVHEYANGAVTLSNDGVSRLPGLVFWPRTSSSESGNVRFEVQIDGAAGSISMPMMFVDNVAAHWPDTLAALTNYYNQDTLAHKRTISHNGTPRRYATESKAGDATFETLTWILKTEGRARTTKDGTIDNDDFSFTPPLEGADQPPFYPYLDTCSIRLNQVGKFTGNPAPLATARYYPAYVKDGFAASDSPGKNASEVFLQTIGNSSKDLPQLSFASSGDRSAGIGRPENQIVALSRKQGPIGGSADKSANQPFSAASPDYELDFTNFDPKSFFGQSADPNKLFGQIGKLLGIIDLGDVIQAVAGQTGMPQLSETIEYYSGQGWDVVRKTILQPLNDTLDALNKTWTTIAVGATGENAAQQIAKLFPDISTTETALRDAVKEALSATSPSVDQQATLISKVYEKARAFVGALDRLASDPIGGVQLVIQKELDKLTRAMVFALDEAVDDLSRKLDDFSNKLFDAVSKIINDETKVINDDTIFDVLFALNDVFAKEQISVPTKATLRTEIKTAIVSALKTPQDKRTLDFIFAGAFAQAVEKLSQTGDLPSGDADILNNLSKTNPARWQGVLFDLLAPCLQNLSNAIEIASTLKGTSKTVTPQAVAQIIDQFSSALSDAAGVWNLVLVWSNAECKDAATIIFKLLAATALAADDTRGKIDDLRACVDNPDSCSPSLLDRVLGRDGNPAKGVAERLIQALNDLGFNSGVAALTQWATRLRDNVKDLLDDLADQLTELRGETGALPNNDDLNRIANECAAGQFSELQDLAKRLVAIAKTREHLFKDVNRINSAIKDAVANFPSVALDGDAKKVPAAALSIQSALLSVLIDPNASPLKDAVTLLNELSPGLIPEDNVAIGATPQALVGKLDGAIGKLKGSSTLEDALKEASTAASDVSRGADAIATAASVVLGRSGEIYASLAGVTKVVIKHAKQPIQSVLLLLKDICAGLDKQLTDALNALQEAQNRKDIGSLIKPLTKQLTSAVQPFANSVSAEIEYLNQAIGALPPDDATSDQLSKARTSLTNAINGLQAIVRAARTSGDAITKIGQTALKGQIAQLIDVDTPRREIETLIRDLVPHKATMAYKLDTALTPVGDFFTPDTGRGGGRLTINTVAVVDLTQGNLAPRTTVKGVLDPVNVHLFGNAFDVVTLKFKQANFGSEPGSNFKFSIDLEDAQLGEMVQFLQALQTYMTPSDGNGFYLRPASGSPGIEVGYGLNLGTISLGPVSFINVSLNAGCRLPFDDSNALFTISLSRPDSPFLISVGIYGGGGYLALIANGKTIVGFEVSFEFGGVSAFSFGPLTGIGRLTTGIFLRKLYDSTTIEGFFFCGGSAHIVCYGISASLMVSISQQPGGSMSGQAVFTFSFSVGPAHIDFHITVFKTQSKLGGSASADPLEPPRTRFAELASDLPPIRLAAQQPSAPAKSRLERRSRVYAATVSPNRNWSKYRRYFANDIGPVGPS